MKSEEYDRPMTSESARAVEPSPLEQQKIQAAPVEDNLQVQWPSSLPALNRSSQKSLSVKSLMSDRTMDKLERAGHRLNEKMLRASIEQTKELRGAAEERGDARRG